MLARIRDLLTDGTTQADVIALLPDIAAQIPDEPSPGEEIPPSALMLINQLGALQQSQQKQIDEMRNQLIALAELLEEERKPWYRRLFS